jgi:hypothetical protein
MRGEGRRSGSSSVWLPRAEEGTASSGAWRDNADRPGGGDSGVRRKETTPEVGQVGRNARSKAKTGRKT